MTAEEYRQLKESLSLIEPLVHSPSLNLEGQAILIENVRRITLLLVDEAHKFTKHKEDALRINKALLGYVLTIPRLEEPSDMDMLTRALHQIECINVASIDIQHYLQKHCAELCTYIEENCG